MARSRTTFRAGGVAPRTRWKGRSGNPRGRAGTLTYDAMQRIARRHSTRALARLVEWMESDEPIVSVRAAQVLLDRAWGTPPQTVAQTATGEDTVRLIYELHPGPGKVSG